MSHQRNGQKKPGLLRSYTSVDMRCAREKPLLALDTPPSKPVLRPKPNLQFDSHGKINTSKKLPSDPRLNFQHHPHSSANQPYSAVNELKKSQSQATSSRTIITHSMSLRLAPKSRREDCRILMSPTMPRSDIPHFSEQIHSSGESTVSASSDHSISNRHFTPSTPRSTVQTMFSGHKSDSEGSDKQSGKPVSHNLNVDTPRRQEKLNPSYRQESVAGLSGISRDQNQVNRQSNSAHQIPNKGAEQKSQLYESVKTTDSRKNPPLPNLRPVVYESRGVRQNTSGIYGTVPKIPPPPYIEPGKNAQKPRSSPHSHQPSNGGYYDDIYSRSHLQRHCPSSRDMVFPSHKPNLTGIETRLTATETPGMMYPRSVGERKQPEHDYRYTSSDVYAERPIERKSGTQEHRVPSHDSQTLHGNEQRYQSNESHSRNERQPSEHRSPHEISSNKPLEQISRHNIATSSSKSYTDRRPLDQNFQMSSQDMIPNTYEHDSKSNKQDQYYKSITEKKVGSQEYRHSPQESFSKAGDRRSNDQELYTTPESSYPSTSERRFSNQEHLTGLQDQYPKAAPGYIPNSQELYSKLPGDRRTDMKPAYINNRPSRPHDQGSWAPRPSNEASADDRPVNEVENPISQGVKMRRGSRDDLALCGSTPSRVKRHASVVLLRRSLIQDVSTPTSPLSVWAQASGDQGASKAPKMEDPWSGSVGVDVDQVAASITSKKDDKMMRAALEALHLRKASQTTPKSSATSHKGSQITPKSSQNPQKSNQITSKVSHSTPKTSQNPPKQNHLSASGGEGTSKTVGSPPQYQPPPEAKPGPFRKQQQYL